MKPFPSGKGAEGPFLGRITQLKDLLLKTLNESQFSVETLREKDRGTLKVNSPHNNTKSLSYQKEFGTLQKAELSLV